MPLGDIVRVESVHKYIVRINGSPELGRFVKVDTKDCRIAGVLSGVEQLIHEELLPYIPPEKLPKYLPYTEDFRESYCVMYGLGVLGEAGARYSIEVAPSVRDIVEFMSPDEIKRFHMRNGKPGAAYLKMHGDNLSPETVSRMLAQVDACMPECRGIIARVKKYVEEKE